MGGGQGGHPSGPQFGLKITGGGPPGTLPWVRHCNSLSLKRAGYRDSAREEDKYEERGSAEVQINFAACYRGEAIKIQTEPSDVNVLGILPMKAAVRKKKPCQEPMTLTLPIFFLPFFCL